MRERFLLGAFVFHVFYGAACASVGWRWHARRASARGTWLRGAAGDGVRLGLAAFAAAGIAALVGPPSGFTMLRYLAQGLFGETVVLAAVLAWSHSRAALPARAVALGLASLGLLAVYAEAYHRTPTDLQVRRPAPFDGARDPHASLAMAEPPGDVTALLNAWGEGSREALDELIPLVYESMRRLAHRELGRERPEGTIGTTALVNEAYLRLVDQTRARLTSRAHFLGLAAQMMRRVLVDEARRRQAAKRGWGVPRIPLDEAPEPSVAPGGGLLMLDDALTRLEAFDPRLGRVVELHYFGGLTLEETAEVLGISTTSVWRDWNAARAWLHEALSSS